MYLILLILLIVVFVEVLTLRRRVAHLEKFKEETLADKNTRKADEYNKQPDETAEKAPILPPRQATAHKEHIQPAKTGLGEEPAEETRKTPEDSPQQPVFSEPSPSPLGEGINKIFQYIRDFFTTGNVVLKVGVVILFFGVSFLLKYAAQRNLIPVELRLAAVASGGVALTVAGWFIGRKKAGYGLVLQGGGVGILYLTVFAASRLYDLLPITFSFIIMFALVVLSGILAVLQDSRSLAALGACGGFLAPVLMSTGTGSHVVLFSYYGLLNTGIFGIAWFKAWRELNLIGFFFTFIISAFWGYNYYQPLHFSTTEPFLLLFFLFYVVISILFAHRQPLQLKGFIDGPLVFGLPIVFFGMQASLVEQVRYGVAFSALGLGFFYILIATLLWKKMVDGMRTLTEAFLALGVVFGSLAIPFALDGHYTASAWALEGAAMVWVGLRQKRLLARNFGIILQLGAAASFLLSPTYFSADDLLFLNQVSLSGFFIAAGALFSSFMLSKEKHVLKNWERSFHYFLLAWGLVWWIYTGVRDIDFHSQYPREDNYMLLFFTMTTLMLGIFNRKLQWHELKYPLMGFLPVLALLVFANINFNGNKIYLEDIGIAAWPTSFIVLYLILKFMEGQWKDNIAHWYHMISLWLLVLVVTHDFSITVDTLIDTTRVWPFVCLAIIPGIFIILLVQYGKYLKWPVLAFREYYLDHGVTVVLCFLVLWSLVSNFMEGDPTPLPHLPLLNPLAITQIFVFLVMLIWFRHSRSMPGRLYSGCPQQFFPMAFGALLFFWLNGVTARMVHLYFDVPFTLNSLFASVIFQSAISILWSGLALTVTIWANRKGTRQVWFAGAVLLCGVVLKLFLVDLSGTGTIARIVSFIAVGSLMLLIGYFSPLPPRPEEKRI